MGDVLPQHVRLLVSAIPAGQTGGGFVGLVIGWTNDGNPLVVALHDPGAGGKPRELDATKWSLTYSANPGHGR